MSAREVEEQMIHLRLNFWWAEEVEKYGILWVTSGY